MRKLIYKSLASILCVSLVWSSSQAAEAVASLHGPIAFRSVPIVLTEQALAPSAAAATHGPWQTSLGRLYRQYWTNASPVQRQNTKGFTVIAGLVVSVIIMGLHFNAFTGPYIGWIAGAWVSATVITTGFWEFFEYLSSRPKVTKPVRTSKSVSPSIPTTKPPRRKTASTAPWGSAKATSLAPLSDYDRLMKAVRFVVRKQEIPLVEEMFSTISQKFEIAVHDNPILDATADDSQVHSVADDVVTQLNSIFDESDFRDHAHLDLSEFAIKVLQAFIRPSEPRVPPVVIPPPKLVVERPVVVQPVVSHPQPERPAPPIEKNTAADDKSAIFHLPNKPEHVSKQSLLLWLQRVLHEPVVPASLEQALLTLFHTKGRRDGSEADWDASVLLALQLEVVPSFLDAFNGQSPTADTTLAPNTAPSLASIRLIAGAFENVFNQPHWAGFAPTDQNIEIAAKSIVDILETRPRYAGLSAALLSDHEANIRFAKAAIRAYFFNDIHEAQRLIEEYSWGKIKVSDESPVVPPAAPAMAPVPAPAPIETPPLEPFKPVVPAVLNGYFHPTENQVEALKFFQEFMKNEIAREAFEHISGLTLGPDFETHVSNPVGWYLFGSDGTLDALAQIVVQSRSVEEFIASLGVIQGEANKMKAAKPKFPVMALLPGTSSGFTWKGVLLGLVVGGVAVALWNKLFKSRKPSPKEEVSEAVTVEAFNETYHDLVRQGKLPRPHQSVSVEMFNQIVRRLHILEPIPQASGDAVLSNQEFNELSRRLIFEKPEQARGIFPPFKEFFQDKNERLTQSLVGIGILIYAVAVIGAFRVDAYPWLLLSAGVVAAVGYAAIRWHVFTLKQVLTATGIAALLGGTLWMKEAEQPRTLVLSTKSPAETFAPAVTPPAQSPADDNKSQTQGTEPPAVQQPPSAPETPPVATSQENPPAKKDRKKNHQQEDQSQPVLKQRPKPMTNPSSELPATPKIEQPKTPVISKEVIAPQLLPLLDSARKQDGEVSKLKSTADGLKPGDAKPLFTYALSGSLEKHPDFTGYGVTFGLPDIPFPHWNPLAKHKEEIDALAKERELAEKTAADQEVLKQRGQAVLDYIQAREKQEALDALTPLTKNPHFLWPAEFEAQRAQMRVEVSQKYYAMLVLLDVPPTTDLSLKSSDELLGELSDDMQGYVGHAAGLDVVSAEEAQEHLHALSDIRWYHRWLSFNSFSPSIMFNLRQVRNPTPWTLFSGGLNKTPYEKLDRVKEAETIRTALANLQTLRETINKEIMEDLKKLQAAHGGSHDADPSIQLARAVVNDPAKPLQDRQAAWQTLLKAGQDSAENAALTAARIRLQFRGIPASAISSAAALDAPHMETFAAKQADFLLDPFKAKLTELQQLADTLPKPPPAAATLSGTPAPGQASFTVTPPAVAYVDGPNRNNPAVPEIAPNKLTEGSGVTLTFPQSNPNNPPITATIGASQAGHHYTLGDVIIGPNLPEQGIVWLYHHLHHSKHSPSADGMSATAGISAQVDPMFLLTGKRPWYPDGGISYSFTYDPSVRQTAKEKAVAAQEKAVLEKKVAQMEEDARAYFVPPVPRANDAAIQGLAHALTTTSDPAHILRWIPYFTISSGDAVWRARFFSLTGNLKPHNIYRHPHKMKEAEDAYQKALAPLKKKLQEIDEQKLSFSIKGLMVVAQARAEAFQATRSALVEAEKENQSVSTPGLVDAEKDALETARKAYVEAYLNVKKALAVLSDTDQQKYGLSWEALPPLPPETPTPRAPVKPSLGFLAIFPLLGLLVQVGVSSIGRFYKEDNSGFFRDWREMIRNIVRGLRYLRLIPKRKPQPMPEPIRYLLLFNRRLPEEQAVLWLQNVMRLPKPLPFMDAMMTFFTTQWNWDKSVQLAYQLTIAKNFEEVAPTLEGIREVSRIFAQYEKNRPTDEKEPDIAKAVDDILTLLLQNKEFEPVVRAQLDDYREFVETAIRAYIGNNVDHASELIQNHILVAPTTQEEHHEAHPYSLFLNASA